jgi:uncharacterized protein YukE
MTLIGMDVERVRALSAQLGHAAEELQQVATELSAQLTSTAWVGRDRDRFAGRWESSDRPALAAISQQLVQAQQSAASSASLQERASS